MPSTSDNSMRTGWRDDGCGDEQVESLAHAVIGAAIEVHRELGPGLQVELKACENLAELHLSQVRA